MRKSTAVFILVAVPACVLFSGCEFLGGLQEGMGGEPMIDPETGEAVVGAVGEAGKAMGEGVSRGLDSLTGGLWSSMIQPVAIGVFSWLAGKFGWLGRTAKGTVQVARKVAGPKPAAKPPKS